MKDEIIAEVWRNRDRLTAKYGHDLNAIVAALQKERRLSERSGVQGARGKRVRARRSH